MIRITAQLKPKSNEVLSFCKTNKILDGVVTVEEADRIFMSLIAVFGADATLDTLTRIQA